MNDNRLLSVPEVAARLNLKRATIYKMIMQRRIAFIKPGGPRGRVLISQRDLETFIAQHRIPSYDEQRLKPRSDSTLSKRSATRPYDDA